MNTNDTFNIVISSRNKLPGDTNSFVTVKLKEDIFVNTDEQLHVCMQKFHSIKSFYACQAGLNDHFQVLFKIPGEDIPIETFDRYISPGNYDVKTLMQEIKRLTNNALFDISYDARLNKYLYKNLFQPAVEVYIKPITAGIFLGFENGKEYQIMTQGTYSSKFINLSGYTNMIIKINGDLNIENTVSNIYGNNYNFDKILGILDISDVAPMDTISYEDNGSCMFKHRINNQRVSEFSIQIVNEDGKEFPQMSDWILVLKLEKNKTQQSMEAMQKSLNDITFFLASMYANLGIPPSVTLEDLIEN